MERSCLPSFHAVTVPAGFQALSQGVFTSSSDVWSFGITCFEIAAMGDIPYGALTNQEVYIKVMDGHTLSPPVMCHPTLVKVMTACLEVDVRFRPTFSALLGGLEGAGLVKKSMSDVMLKSNALYRAADRVQQPPNYTAPTMETQISSNNMDNPYLQPGGMVANPLYVHDSGTLLGEQLSTNFGNVPEGAADTGNLVMAPAPLIEGNPPSVGNPNGRPSAWIYEGLDGSHTPYAAAAPAAVTPTPVIATATTVAELSAADYSC